MHHGHVLYRSLPGIVELNMGNYRQITKKRRGATTWIVHFYSDAMPCPACRSMRTQVEYTGKWVEELDAMGLRAEGGGPDKLIRCIV